MEVQPSAAEHSYAQPSSQPATTLILPSIKALLSTSVSTLRHIPKAARGDWTRILSDALNGVLGNTESERHWSILFAAPKCILAAPKRGGSDHQRQTAAIIKQRAERWRKGEINELWMEASAPLEPRRKGRQNLTPAEQLPQADYNKRRCLRLVQDGQYSRGVQSLSSRGIDQSSTEAFKAMQDKHPFAAAPSPLATEPSPSLSLDVAKVKKAIFSFKAGTAPGPSGLRAEHLKLALQAPTPARGDNCASILTNFVNLMASGKLPPSIAPFFCSANLFAARKKDGGHRPIAVGEVLRRLISKCLAFESAAKASEILSPLQVGVGVRGGVEAVIHAFRSTLEDENVPSESKWVMQLDFNNAFNTISRNTVIKETRRLFPELAAWTESTYGYHSNLYFGSAVLNSSTGLHQGDPLAPLLFAVSTFPLAEKIKSEVPDILLHLWFLDDGNLMAPLSALQRAYDIVEAESPSLGLTLSSSKSSIWSPIPAVRATAKDPLQRGIPMKTEDGFELLGAPIGSADFSNSLVTSRVEKLRHTLAELPKLEDSHVEFVLLRSCLSLPKLSFSLRTCPPDHLAASLKLFDGLMRDALGSILGVGLSDRQWIQASLPVSLGGMGLRQAALHSSAAYAVSSAHTYTLVSAMMRPLIYQPDISLPLSVINSRSSRSYTLDDLKDASQKQVSHNLDLQAQKSLYNGAADPRERARLGCVLLSHSGDWLNAIPSKAMNIHMRPSEFRVAAKYRLGIPVFPASESCPIQDCTQENDIMGDHAIGCGHSGERTSRHNRLRDTIFKAATSACLAPGQEIRGLVSGSEARPADVFIPAWEKG